MKKIILILIIFSIALPSFGYKVIKRSIPRRYYYSNPKYYRYNFPYSRYSTSYNYRLSPIKRIKNYFIGTPTGWTNTPYYNNNQNNIRGFFNDSGENSYYYDNGGYYTKNHEVTGGGSVTIIND